MIVRGRYLGLLTHPLRKRPLSAFKSVFLVKEYHGYTGYVGLGTGINAYFPRPYIGQRIRFKVEVLGEHEKV